MSEKPQKYCEICQKQITSKDSPERNELCHHEYHSNCFLDYSYNYVKGFNLPIKCPNEDCGFPIALTKLFDKYSSSQLSKLNKRIRSCESCEQYSLKRQMKELSCGHLICEKCQTNKKECKKCKLPQEIKEEKVKKCYLCKEVGVQRNKMKCCRKKICFICLKNAFNSYKNNKNNQGSQKKFLCPNCNKKNHDEDLASFVFEEQKNENESKEKEKKKKIEINNKNNAKCLCDLCKNNDSFINFSLLCGHFFCIKCFFQDSFTAFPEKCPLNSCKKEIDENISSDFFSCVEDLKKIEKNRKTTKEETQATKIICEICLNKFGIENLLTLSCDHRFCKFCLLKDWETKLNELKINDNFWICPKEKCRQRIDHEIIKANMPPQLFLKYDELLLNHTMKNLENLQNLKENEKLVNCPQCSIEYIVGKDYYYFNCEKCKEIYCAKETCYRKWSEHTKGYCDFPENKKDESDFDNYVKENKLKQCPVCKFMIEKTAHCNYICCGSITCQKKTYFCYLCGEKLKKNELQSHYLNNSSYSKCKKI